MKIQSRCKRIAKLLTSIGLVAQLSSAARGGTAPLPWPMWGGPAGNFKASAEDLSESWPLDGPPLIWKRALGEGYSPVSADEIRLYTMYRSENEEIIVAVDRATGATVWEHRYPATPDPTQTTEFGGGPSAMPLIFDDRLITIGFTGRLTCLSLKTGKQIWSQDLVADHQGKVHYYGYANSPIAYRDMVLVAVGGQQTGVVALDPSQGSVVWRSDPYDTSYASPILIDVDGQDQYVFFTTTHVVGLEARTGAHAWSFPVVNMCKTNCTSAVWGDGNLLWAATKGVGGTRMLRLSQHDGKTEVEEVWTNRKIRVYHWNAQRIGDYVYTSSGDTNQFMSVIEAATGTVVKKIRGFGSTNSIQVADKLVFLDSEGMLVLAKIVPGDLEIVSKARVADSITWTPPTLVKTTLIVRDRTDLMAFDLGRKTDPDQRK